MYCWCSKIYVDISLAPVSFGLHSHTCKPLLRSFYIYTILSPIFTNQIAEFNAVSDTVCVIKRRRELEFSFCTTI